MRIAAAALIAAAVGIVAGRGLVAGRVAENWTRDLRVAALTPALPRSPDVVVIAITEDTLAQLAYRSPVDRQFLADLLHALAAKGVRAIGVDLLVDQPSESAKDAALLAALAAVDVPVVMASASTVDGLTERQAEWSRRFLREARRGSAAVLVDPVDSTVRTVPVAPSASDEPLGLAAALAEAVAVPVPARSELVLDYRRSSDPGEPFIARYPAHAVALLPQAWLRGRIALIGVDVPLADRHRTPLSVLGEEDPPELPGVSIHAQALAQIIDGRELADIGDTAQLGFVAMTALAGSLLALTPAPLVAVVGLNVVGLVLLWAGAFAVYRAGGPLLPLVAPSVAFAAGTGMAALLRLRAERSARRFVQRAFSKYLAPELVENLVARPEKLVVGGERRVLTFLFTDVADFTALVEGMESAPVLDLLNDYLDGACRLVMAHGGTIDKIVGDALHVMFNAPQEQPDHRARAIRCAVELEAFSRAFVERQHARGVDFGVTRIGVHTGPVVVGNFGGAERFDYTAHGDAINTAARLEGANKHLGTSVLISGETAVGADAAGMRPVGRLLLKGKQCEIDVFEPMRDEAAERLAPIGDYRAAFAELESRSDQAAGHFARLAREYPDDSLVALHARRLADGDTGVTISLGEK